MVETVSVRDVLRGNDGFAAHFPGRLWVFVVHCGVMVVLSLAAQSASAETLADPTRPAMPSEQAVPAEGVTKPQVGVGMVVTAKEGVMALYDGRILRLGSRIDSGVVVRIAPDAVFVRAADGKMTRLPLYPDVGVQPVVQKEGEEKSKDKGAGKVQAKAERTRNRSVKK